MKKQRLFFALWPSDDVRQAIVDSAAPVLSAMEGRVISPQNLHITLHFIGSTSTDVKHCLHTSAQSVNFRPFTLSLDCLGHFKKAKVFWMGMRSHPAALDQLHLELGNALVACDYKTEQRRYSPHVSLLRKARPAVYTEQPISIEWLVDEFVLLESVSGMNGVKYEVVERYPCQK